MCHHDALSYYQICSLSLSLSLYQKEQTFNYSLSLSPCHDDDHDLAICHRSLYNGLHKTKYLIFLLLLESGF